MRLVKIYSKKLQELKKELEKLGIENIEVMRENGYLIFTLKSLKKLPNIYELASKFGDVIIILKGSENKDVSEEIKAGLTKIGELL